MGARSLALLDGNGYRLPDGLQDVHQKLRRLGGARVARHFVNVVGRFEERLAGTQPGELAAAYLQVAKSFLAYCRERSIHVKYR